MIRYRFRFCWAMLGSHVHVRVFAGADDGTLGKAGDLVFREDEWAAFRERLCAVVIGQSLPVFDVVEEDAERGEESP